MKKIILASSSPRRIEMMKKYGYSPEIIPAHIDEDLPFNMTPEASVMYLALKKATYVNKMLRKKAADESREYSIYSDDSIIIAADTIVVYNDKIIGKPFNMDEAFETLKLLRNNKHRVITGVSIFPRRLCFYDVTQVYFKDYSDTELTRYVNTSEPYDKAGGYAIQGTFKKYIHHIEGDLDNVIGFPWYKIKQEIENS